MKTHVKKEMKKYPYHRNRNNIFTQIRAREQRIKEKLPNYAIVDENNKIIEKYRLLIAARNSLIEMQKDHYEKLRVVTLDENGDVPNEEIPTFKELYPEEWEEILKKVEETDVV